MKTKGFEIDFSGDRVADKTAYIRVIFDSYFKPFMKIKIREKILTLKKFCS